ncbi:hypothetical protein PACID_15600 [Acidipropionibacterium acidipropionici ATCC 4875]|uniref:Uncharacterized protein n=2 Tax=Acidipropionibacterium acidipropionici TaxID=1748 RepID=K7RWQ7_ACIA4|nr:hypothetical protein PACID_15600 [Acidipropionibacterium acidipropionici ATCC 4875]
MLAIVISDQASIHHITGRSGTGMGGYHCSGCDAHLDLTAAMWHHPEQQAQAAREYLADQLDDLHLTGSDSERITVREVEVWNRAIDAATTTIRNGAKK